MIQATIAADEAANKSKQSLDQKVQKLNQEINNPKKQVAQEQIEPVEQEQRYFHSFNLESLIQRQSPEDEGDLFLRDPQEDDPQINLQSVEVTKGKVKSSTGDLFDFLNDDNQPRFKSFSLNMADKDNRAHLKAETLEDIERLPETDQNNAVTTAIKAKSGEKIRRDYLSRLTYNRVWLTPSQKPKLYETVIIFDWDDTLLATSFINPTGVFNPQAPVTRDVMKQMTILEKYTTKILEMSVKHGVTYIITNAGEGWVEYSAKKFMPSCIHFLNKTKIISARAKYEKVTEDYTKWKLNAFMEAKEQLAEAHIKNIIALGDNQLEIDAANTLAEQLEQSLIKTIKFREFPRPNELVKQLNLVIDRFEEICTSAKSITIRLEKKQGEK